MIFGIRLFGAILILSGSIGMAVLKNMQFESRYQLIKESGRILAILEQKIVFHNIPLECFFRELTNEGLPEWKKMLDCMEQKMELEKEDFFHTYEKMVMEKGKELKLMKEEQAYLLEILKVLLAYDKAEASMELKYLLKEQNMMSEQLNTRRKERKKISMAFGVAGGIVGILIFF